MSKLYVHKLRDKSLIMRDLPLTKDPVKIKGVEYTMTKQSNVKFGVLVVRAKDGITPIDHTKGLKVGLDESLDGFKIGDTAVIHQETGEAIPNLFWVEKA